MYVYHINLNLYISIRRCRPDKVIWFQSLQGRRSRMDHVREQGVVRRQFLNFITAFCVVECNCYFHFTDVKCKLFMCSDYLINISKQISN